MLDGLVIHPTTRQLIEKTAKSMPHALIIHGQKGSGESAIALALAQSVGSLLETVLPKKRQTNGTYSVDRESGTIIIEDVRALYEKTRSKFTTPQVVVIDFSGRPMSTGAQNAFLKLLEEPQSQIHFILAVSDMSTLLPTIVSRCQRIDVLPTTTDQTQTQLDKLGVSDPTKRARISFIASGRPAEINRLVTDEEYYDSRVKTIQDARAILEGDSYTRMKIVQTYKDKRHVALQLIDDMIAQLKLSLQKTPSPSTIEQLDALLGAYDHIRGNGNIALALAKVLL